MIQQVWPLSSHDLQLASTYLNFESNPRILEMVGNSKIEISQDKWSLRRLEEKDLPIVLAWRNDPQIRRVSQSDHIIQPEEHAAWFHKHSGNPHSMLLMFEESGIPRGCVNFTDINNGIARWGFYLDPQYLEQGLGKRLGKIALDLAFGKLQLKRVNAEVVATNERGFQYHKKLGFQWERTEQSALQRGPQKIDLHHLFNSAEIWSKVSHSLS